MAKILQFPSRDPDTPFSEKDLSILLRASINLNRRKRNQRIGRTEPSKAADASTTIPAGAD